MLQKFAKMLKKWYNISNNLKEVLIMKKRRIFDWLLCIGLFIAGVVMQLMYGKGSFNGATMVAIVFILIALAIFYFGEERIYAFFKRQINLLIKEPEKTRIIEVESFKTTVVKPLIIEIPKNR